MIKKDFSPTVYKYKDSIMENVENSTLFENWRKFLLSEKLMLARGLCSTWRKLQGAQFCCGQQAAKQGRAVRPAVEGFPTVRDADNSCSADAVVVV